MPKNNQKWTNEQVELLKNEWPNKSARKDLAEKLGRSIPALQVKYLSLREQPEGKQPRKRRVTKNQVESPVGENRQVAETVENQPLVSQDKLKDLLDSCLNAKDKGSSRDTGSLLLEATMNKGMKQMLLLAQQAGYIPAADVEKILKVFAKYEKKLMWDALKEHFVSNSDEE